jgi:hypothetical protein
MEMWEIYTKFQSEHTEVRDDCGDEVINDRILLKRIVEI